MVTSIKEFKEQAKQMFTDLDLDNSEYLSITECLPFLAQIMRECCDYNAESFKAHFETMDKNDDGKISRAEFEVAVLKVAKDMNMF
jgi:Ca2+-binding EF-hand superfamily protein